MIKVASMHWRKTVFIIMLFSQTEPPNLIFHTNIFASYVLIPRRYHFAGSSFFLVRSMCYDGSSKNIKFSAKNFLFCINLVIMAKTSSYALESAPWDLVQWYRPCPMLTALTYYNSWTLKVPSWHLMIDDSYMYIRIYVASLHLLFSVDLSLFSTCSTQIYSNIDSFQFWNVISVVHAAIASTTTTASNHQVFNLHRKAILFNLAYNHFFLLRFRSGSISEPSWRPLRQLMMLLKKLNNYTNSG